MSCHVSNPKLVSIFAAMELSCGDNPSPSERKPVITASDYGGLRICGLETTTPSLPPPSPLQLKLAVTLKEKVSPWDPLVLWVTGTFAINCCNLLFWWKHLAIDSQRKMFSVQPWLWWHRRRESWEKVSHAPLLNTVCVLWLQWILAIFMLFECRNWSLTSPPFYNWFVTETVTWTLIL